MRSISNLGDPTYRVTNFLSNNNLDAESVLSAFQSETRPLSTLLERVATSLEANFSIWIEFDGLRASHVFSCQVFRYAQNGRRIPLPRRKVQKILDDHQPFPRQFFQQGLGGHSRALWYASAPLLAGAPLPSTPVSAGLIVGGRNTPFGSDVQSDSALMRGVLERVAPWLHTAFVVESSQDFGEEVQTNTSLPLNKVFLPEFPDIIAVSNGMRAVLETVSRVASSDATVLIKGESGTGKELIARAIHQQSHRRSGPLISENCAACPQGLLESEFFGVERGAYTGALASRPGIFERARNGTLVLDEIGEMDIGLQAKLLRVLQEREIRRVGGNEIIPIDFRLVTSTNRDLGQAIANGGFRLDLLYRLEVVQITLPPLRERREDIPHLVRHFLQTHAGRLGRPVPPVTSEALQHLVQYSWPGNIRELENEMCRTIAFGHRTVRISDLSQKILSHGNTGRPVSDGLEGRSFKDLEREILGSILTAALIHTRGNGREAARLLGIPKTSFYRKLQMYRVRTDRHVGDNSQPISRSLARYRFLDNLLASHVDKSP